MRNFFKGKKMSGYVSKTSVIHRKIDESFSGIVDVFFSKKKIYII